MARAVPVLRRLAGLLLPGAIVLAVVVAVVSWQTGGSASGRARNEVQALFSMLMIPKRPPRVTSCDQIGANADARIYLCEITATGCTRIFRFAVYRDPVYGAEPVTAPLFALRHPCTPFHT